MRKCYATAFILAPWAAIGFAGVMEYPHLLNLLSRVEGRDGYTISALLSGAMPLTAARAVGIAAGLAVLVTSLRIARRDERASFALAVAAVLLLSPIVDMHYFVLLVVVLGLFRPRLDWVWGVPLLLWVAPQVGNGATWQTGAALAVAAATVTLALGERRRPVSAAS